VVWIEIADLPSAKQLVQRLVCDFGGESISLVAAGSEVLLKMEFESGAVVARAHQAIENWRDETGSDTRVLVGRTSDSVRELHPIASGQ
jgi:hypothetical protein